MGTIRICILVTYVKFLSKNPAERSKKPTTPWGEDFLKDPLKPRPLATSGIYVELERVLT